MCLIKNIWQNLIYISSIQSSIGPPGINNVFELNWIESHLMDGLIIDIVKSSLQSIWHQKKIKKYIWKTQQYFFFSTIMTRPLKIIHRFNCEQFNVGLHH